MTAPSDDADLGPECDDDPKLTGDEWQAIEVLSRRDDA